MDNSNLYNICGALFQSSVFPKLFDITRVVDAQAGRVVETSGEQPTDAKEGCVEVFGCVERCSNCTSIRALITNEQVVKLEHIGGKVLLFISVPVEVNGRRLVAEAIKDITGSLSANIGDPYRKSEILRLVEKFNATATTDALTGLMNRQFIDEKMPDMIKNSRYMRRPVSAALLKVNSFEEIERGHGKQISDSVLRDLAAVLLSFVRRGNDFAARYGKDMFLFCFVGTPLNICLEICSRLSNKIEKTSFKYNNVKIPVTISFSAAESSEIGEAGHEELITLVTARLEEAIKGNGRLH